MTGAAVLARRSQLAGGQGRELSELHCKLGQAMQIEPGLRPAVSQKREVFKCPPETIGYFAQKMPKIVAWRLVANSQKPAIGGPFCEYQGHFLRAPDCLAGDAVLIAPVSTPIPC